MSKNEDIYEFSVWTFSHNQRAIALYQSRLKLNQPLIFIGGVHGDEPEGVFLAEETLKWLKTQKGQELRDWILIPCLNPDGYLSNQRVNGRGVDLNRNYPSRNWTSDCKEARYNPGPHASSEPEIQSLVDLIRTHKPSLIIHCHSWKPCIVCSGPTELFEAQLLSEASQYEIKNDIGYPTPGSLSEYAWHDLKIPVICIEEREGAERQETWERFSPAIKQIFTMQSRENS